MKYRYIAPCHFGLEKTLSFEVGKIGGEDITVSDGRVMFSGGAEVCAKANIGLSTAERVCAVLGQFRARTFDELFEGILRLPLSDYIGRYDAFPNSGHSLNSVLKSVPACQKIVKKAMAVNLGKSYGVNVMAESGAECKVRFSLMKDEFTLMLDTSGAGLHKRGYRRESNAAPIKETLAAGIIDIARVRERDTVCDPFCGSGTLLIEAALKALNIAPGLRRHFAGERYGFLPAQAWQSAREQALEAIRHDSEFRAVGYDIDGECVELTLANAKKAGLEKYVKAEKRDIRDFSYGTAECKVITNPPYGERMLELSQARELYGIMGQRLLPRGGNQLYIITPDEEFEDIFGLKSDKNRKLYNGMMMCRLYQYFKN
ncbi:MAG: class I SAM-dependent RNA methyltransferase [Oscillospiraceae bacterium]|nr:class I SAM-dependent RNA methyltransferase [Oscillospiraceae bacterium]